MPIQALGYAGFGSADLDDWRQFGTGLVGLQAVERGNSLLAFRMDDRKQRIVIDRAMPDGARFFGWEVADAADLDALAARLEQAGVDVTAEPQTLADARRVRGLISFHDPAGNRLEAFYGAEIDDTPFRPGRSISGFRTGPLGLGHAVLTVEDIDAMMPFYVDLLGFGLSDYMLKPFRAYFFHINARHHSLALIETGKTACITWGGVVPLDDVGQVATSPDMEDGSVTLGCHTNDFMPVLCQVAIVLHDEWAGAAARSIPQLAAGRDTRRPEPVGLNASGCRLKIARWRATWRRAAARAGAPVQVMEGTTG
jgi:2,3-dihydroxybiphenyl 1,2-dioxygenase